MDRADGINEGRVAGCSLCDGHGAEAGTRKQRERHVMRNHLTVDCTTHSRQHSAVASTLTNMRKPSVAQVDKERPAPDFYDTTKNEYGGQEVKEAILDLEVNFLKQLCTSWIDVSVRALVAKRYKVTARRMAACAEKGEAEKVKRYKGSALPKVMETFGRLGPEWRKALNLMAVLAGPSAKSTPVLHVWRDHLRRAVRNATADATLQERGSAGTRA